MPDCLDLEPFAHRPLEGSVVSDLDHEPRDLGSEPRLDLVPRRIRVLERIVEHPRNHELKVLAIRGLGEHGGDLDHMVDVGLRSLALAPVVDVVAGCEVDGT